jgi:hypothetical protein
MLWLDLLKHNTSYEDANHFCLKMMIDNLINNNMIIDQLYNNLKGKEWEWVK